MNIIKKTSSAAARADALEPEVLKPLAIIEQPDSADAAERIRFHLRKGVEHGRCAIAHIIEAGWELALQKRLLGYGQWSAWCEEKLKFSRQTVEKYIAAFQRTVGAMRAQQQIPLDKKLLEKELSAATVGMEEKTVRQAMIEMGIVKPDAGRGGARDGAGRKTKGVAEVAAELEAIAKNENLLWAAAKGSLDALCKLASEKNLFYRLSDDHLAAAASVLADLSSAAGDALGKRLESSTLEPRMP